MISWAWTHNSVLPADIIGGMKTLPIMGSPVGFRIVDSWTPSSTYLGWAKKILARKDVAGWDFALCYAKRAVCRAIDALFICNHFGHLIQDNYPSKLETLAQVGISIPGVVYDLIIAPRNALEHEYDAPTEKSARHAVDVAGLFLDQVSAEVSRGAIISLGTSGNYRRDRCDKPGAEYDRISFDLLPNSRPMFLVDVLSTPHRAVILIPKDKELLVAPMDVFSRPEVLQLVQLLRAPLAAGNYRWYDLAEFTALKDQFKL
jgi:hypothetical protein